MDRLLARAALAPAPPIQTGPTAFSGEFLGPHQVMLIDDGPASFNLRMKMVESARREIDLEYFEFLPDTAGKLLLQALVAKKQRMNREHQPFRVRILLDHLFFVPPEDPEGKGIDQFMASELARNGIEVKYYHPSIWPPAIDQRNHQKLFLVDGRQFITGGRNIRNQYFGFSPRFDYQDSDIYVQGPAAGGAQASFNAYWSSDSSHVPVVPAPPWLEPPPGRRQPDVAERQRKAEAYQAALNKARELLLPTPSLQQEGSRIAARGDLGLRGSRVIDADSVTFLSDLPGGGDASRRVIPEILRQAGNARRSIVMENWTFVPVGPERRELKRILARHVPFTLLTNSFDSSRVDIAEDVKIIDLSYPRQVRMARDGMRVYAYRGKPSPPPDGPSPGLDDTARLAWWGDHTKRACFDHESCFVGSANLDGRSLAINSEIGVVINHNPAFAREVEASIRNRIHDAYEVDPRGRYLECRDGHEAVAGPSAHDLSGLGGLSRFFEELTVDQW